MFDAKITAMRTKLAALETEMEQLAHDGLQMAAELHAMQDRLTGLLEDEAGAGAAPIDVEIPLLGKPTQDDDGRWFVWVDTETKEYWDPAIHSANRSVTPSCRFRRRRTVHKAASEPEAPKPPPEPGNGSDGAEQPQTGVSAADTNGPPAVVSMKQYISAAENIAKVREFMQEAGEHAEAGYYTDTDLADIRLTAERRLKTLEGRS